MPPFSREELPVLRRSCRRAPSSGLRSSLINWNNEVFSNSAFSIDESEDALIRRSVKRSRKTNNNIITTHPQRISTTDSTPSSSPVGHHFCTVGDHSSTDEDEDASASRRPSDWTNPPPIRKRTRHGNLRIPSSEASMTLRSSGISPPGTSWRRTQLQTASTSVEPIGDAPTSATNEDEDLESSESSSTDSTEQLPDESCSMRSLEESDLATDDVTMSASLIESTGDVEEDDECCSERSCPSNGEARWENVGDTKTDDDRVVDEVNKRYEMAAALCAEIAPSVLASDKKSLLEQLLDQSNKYTEFMLAKSLSAAAPPDGKVYEKGEDRTLTPTSAPSQSRQAKVLKRQQRLRDREEELLMQEAEDELRGHQREFWTRLSKQPASITGGTLKPYQLDGLNWLIHLYESGLNGILADEMGLGKTLQTLSLLAYLKESRRISGPHLILAPKSTLGNWLNEIKKFCPSLKAYRFHGTKQERREAKDRGHLDFNTKRHDIFITSYELCIREQSVFRKFNFRYIIVDEAHRIKNEASKLSKIIRTFKAQFRLLLTGTPLQNNLRELWSLLNFLFPEMFSSSEEFDRLFDLTGAFDDSSKTLSSDEKTSRNTNIVARLHKILKPFLLRRLKSEVVVELPPKTELLLYVPLSKMQRALYKDLLARNVDFLTDTGGRVRLLNLAMQLRKSCCHPYLFEGYEDKSLDPFGEHLIFNSGKLVLLDRLLLKLISSGSRILIFTQMTRMLDILEDYCRLRAFRYCRLDGSTLGEEREKQIEEFNAENSPQSIFLLSTRAGGLGINLATADTVIIYDSDFNPQVDLQAMDRAHRIGQKKHVNVYRLIHEHTIEEKIIERAMLKLRLDTAVIQQGRLSDRQSQQLSKTDLMRFIQFGADQIYKSSTNDITELTDEDIELILQRGEQRTIELSGKLESHVQHKTTNLLDFDFSSVANLYEFEGVDYNADKHAWAEMGVSAIIEERNAKRKVRVAQEQLEELHRQQQLQTLASSSLSGGPSKGRNLKLPRMEEWQFFDRHRISELHDRELEFMSGSSDGIFDEQKFTEREEKEALLEKGFGDWTRRDFFNFVKSCETVGSDNIEAIAKDVGKSEHEIKRYLITFMERYNELTDGDKWLKRVKAGDDVQLKRQQMEQLLMDKLRNHGAWWRSTIRFSKSRTQFTDDEDLWLLNATLAVGYGNWEQLQLSINVDPCWMLNWFMRSRTAQDLGRRIEFLVRQIQKEACEETETRSKAKEPATVIRRSEDDFRLYPLDNGQTSFRFPPAAFPATRLMKRICSVSNQSTATAARLRRRRNAAPTRSTRVKREAGVKGRERTNNENPSLIENDESLAADVQGATTMMDDVQLGHTCYSLDPTPTEQSQGSQERAQPVDVSLAPEATRSRESSIS